MDPNANLREQEHLIKVLRVYPTWKSDRARLNELRKALSEWLASGGFQPEWAVFPSAARYYGR